MEPSGRNDVEVFVDSAVPIIFEDAFAVNVDGTLKVLRWSTRHEAKCRPVGEFRGWLFYRHLGEQGDEAVPRLAQTGQTQAPRDAHEHFARIGRAALPPQPEPTPEHPLERESRLRDAERAPAPPPQPAVVRPPIPPKGADPEPTGLLPVRRTPDPTDGGAPTQLLEPVPAPEPETDAPDHRRPGRRLPGTSVWTAMAAAALSFLAAVR